jgi:hypothetical protein
MKHRALVAALILFLTFSLTGKAQTYTVSGNNQSWASLISGGTCNNCTINIPAGWTLLLNSYGTCKGCTFNGGTVNITSSFDFSNGTTTFTNDTLLINKTTSFNSVSFSNDSIAVNFPLSSSNSTSTIDHTRMQMNANATFNSANFTNDSIHVANTTLKVNNSTSSFTSTFIEVSGNSGSISLNAAAFTGSNVVLSNNATLTTSNAFSADGASFTMHDASTMKASSITMSNNSNVVMDGTSNSLTSSNALTISNTTMTMNSNSTVKASSITATSTTIAASGGTITSDNALKMTSSTLTGTGAMSIKASSVTLQTGSAMTLASGSNLKSDNAITVDNSNFSADGSTIKSSSFTAQANSTITLSGTSNLTTDNSIDIKGSRMNLYGDAWANAKGSLIIESAGVVTVGDGTSASTAHLMTNNSLQVLGGSQLGIANGNNYLYTSANTYTDGSHSYTIKTNSISCGSGHSNACATGYVYGCATLNNGGAVGCVTLALSVPELTACVSNGQVLLSWQLKTAADRFLIQRSTNGTDWTLVGEVMVNDYSSNYSIRDAQTQPGVNYYRLQLVDRDGRSATSPIASVTLDAVVGQTTVFPNPVKGHTFFLKTPSTDAVMLKVFTISGQLLLLSPLKGQTQYQLQLPATPVTNTWLLVQVIGNGRTQTFTVLAQ